MLLLCLDMHIAYSIKQVMGSQKRLLYTVHPWQCMPSSVPACISSYHSLWASPSAVPVCYMHYMQYSNLSPPNKAHARAFIADCCVWKVSWGCCCIQPGSDKPWCNQQPHCGKHVLVHRSCHRQGKYICVRAASFLHAWQ